MLMYGQVAEMHTQTAMSIVNFVTGPKHFGLYAGDGAALDPVTPNLPSVIDISADEPLAEQDPFNSASEGCG